MKPGLVTEVDLPTRAPVYVDASGLPSTGRIRLLTAWPKDWDVVCKLHAPDKTVVEVVCRGGKFENLKVTPKSRSMDVMMPEVN